MKGYCLNLNTFVSLLVCFQFETVGPTVQQAVPHVVWALIMLLKWIIAEYDCEILCTPCQFLQGIFYLKCWIQRHIRNMCLDLPPTQIRYQALNETGTGPSVVLVHGLFVNADHWRRNMQPLADAGYRVYAIDLLGCGFPRFPRYFENRRL